jgi:hypothetical protein
MMGLAGFGVLRQRESGRLVGAKVAREKKLQPAGSKEMALGVN